MGFCSRRYFFLSICLLQMISVIQREVFDFLGFLWIPILVNFFEIIFIILGFFGAYQYRPKYIISYILWHLFWLAWNVFIICLYLDVAGLDHKTNKVLKLDSKSESWWNNEGPGCKKIVPLADEPWNANVENCFINYVHVEVFQAGLQCFLSFLGILIGICVCRLFLEEDDTFSYEDSKGAEHLFLHPMYVSSTDSLNNKRNFLLKNHHNYYPASYKRGERRVYGDAIRYPATAATSANIAVQRSSSFDKLDSTNDKRTKRTTRPKSLGSNAFDSFY